MRRRSTCTAVSVSAGHLLCEQTTKALGAQVTGHQCAVAANLSNPCPLNLLTAPIHPLRRVPRVQIPNFNNPPFFSRLSPSHSFSLLFPSPPCLSHRLLSPSPSRSLSLSLSLTLFLCPPPPLPLSLSTPLHPSLSLPPPLRKCLSKLASEARSSRPLLATIPSNPMRSSALLRLSSPRFSSAPMSNLHPLNRTLITATVALPTSWHPRTVSLW